MIVRPTLDPGLAWFPQARFGMFIHFGLYALLERGEWVMYNESIPREEYAKLAERFDPSRFEAEEWVRTAERAGARYITVTAKHHDGFCLFDSALTDFKITNTPFRRDLIGELVAACQRRNMRIILYYSQPDWHHPNYVHRRGAFKDLQYARPDDRPDWDAYTRFYIGQVEELCTRYGRIDGIWFDGVHKTEREWRGREVYALIKHHQPAAVVNDRAGYGDFFTPERGAAAQASAAGYVVEACQSVSQEAWGYRRDTQLYTTPLLVRSLVRMAAAGSNYLLNVGPLADGSLPGDWVQRLDDVGAWLRTHGEAIYGTRGCVSPSEGEDLIYTQREATLYTHILRWPDTDTLTLRCLARPPRAASLLATGTPLRVQGAADGVVLRGLPSSPPHCAVNVVRLEFEDEPHMASLPKARSAPTLSASGADPLILDAESACVRGFGLKGSVLRVATMREAEIRVLRPAERYLTGWSSVNQSVAWEIASDAPRRCQVSVELGCPAPYAGSHLVVEVAGQQLSGIVPSTDGFADMRSVELGDVVLPAGTSTVVLRPTELNYGYVFAAIRGVTLRLA